MAHSVPEWILICSRSSASATETLVTSDWHGSDADSVVIFLRDAGGTAMSLARSIAGLPVESEPATGRLSTSDAIKFWGNRAVASLRALGETAVYAIDHSGLDPAIATTAIDLFESVEAKAQSLFLSRARGN